MRGYATPRYPTICSTSFSYLLCRFLPGAAILRELECSGIGTPVERAWCASAENLRRSCVQSNAELIKTLRDDPLSADIPRITRNDAALGRMSHPVSIDSFDDTIF